MNLSNGIRDYIQRMATTPRYPRKRVLVLEGGGMRGVFLAGVLQGFTDRGYFPWKVIVGSSAGALTGAAYAAGQIHLARDAFFGSLLTHRFIQVSHLLNQARHVVDLDWMVDTVATGEEPLDVPRLRQACQLLITATDCQESQPPKTVYLDSSTEDVVTALKASAAIPFLYRGFVEYMGKKLLDGGLLDPIPFRHAMQLGYSEEEILVVLTRPKGYRKKRESSWVTALYQGYFHHPSRQKLVESLQKRFHLYNAQLDDLEGNCPKLDVLYPPEHFRVDRLTVDPKRLLEGFVQGSEAARGFLMG